MKNWLSGVVAASLMISATFAFGANKAGEFSLSPVIGGYALDKKQNLNTNLLYVYGARAGYNFTKSLGVEGLFDYANTAKDRGGKGDTGMYRYGGEMLYHMWPDNKVVPYLAGGYSGIHFDGSGISNKTRGAFDYGLGAKFFPYDTFALRGDVRHIIYTYEKTYNNLEFTLGAYIPFGGVKPSVKPLEPVQESAAPKAAPAAAVVTEQPTPPTSSISVTPALVEKGRSAKLVWDSKNTSACEIQPEIGKVEASGSMSVTPSADTTYTLTCSGAGGSTTSGTNISVTMPPPVKAAAPPQQAAPKSAAAMRFCDKPAVLAIVFASGKADIQPKFKNDLNKLGAFLKEYPKAKGEISGHTDNVGSKQLNDKLSQRRADSVKKYIVDTYKIEQNRVTSKGYGFAKPVADNKTAAGKAKNRRIEANFSCE